MAKLKINMHLLNSSTGEITDDVYIITSSDCVIFSDGKTLSQKLNEIELIPGPQGPQGLKGDKGDKGDPGNDGVGLTAEQAALIALVPTKVDIVPNKTLSTNDYTDVDKAKVVNLPENVLGYVAVEGLPMPSPPLNADRLSGHEAEYFAPLASPAFTGTPTVNGMVAATTETVKITELLNGWTAWGNIYYPHVTRVGNIVHVTAVLESGTLSHETTLFALPEGYRPAVIKPLSCQALSGAKSIAVTTDGRVYIDASGLGAWVTGRYYFDFVIPIKER